MFRRPLCANSGVLWRELDRVTCFGVASLRQLDNNKHKDPAVTSVASLPPTSAAGALHIELIQNIRHECFVFIHNRWCGSRCWRWCGSRCWCWCWHWRRHRCRCRCWCSQCTQSPASGHRLQRAATQRRGGRQRAQGFAQGFAQGCQGSKRVGGSGCCWRGSCDVSRPFVQCSQRSSGVSLTRVADVEGHECSVCQTRSCDHGRA